LTGRRSKPDRRSSAYWDQLLAVARHVDARLLLPFDDLYDRTAEARGIGLLVVGNAALLRANELQELGRPDQAADVRGEDSLVASSHGSNVSTNG
jgi:hypothetical protein